MPQFIDIEDPDDPRIAPYRDVRERDLVGRRGCFIAEGEVVLRVLLRGRRHMMLSALIDEKRAPALSKLLAEAPAGAPLYRARRAVMDAITGFPIHRGILALGEKGPTPDVRALLRGARPGAVAAVLLGIANHDNIGGILRNVVGLGADAVILDAQCCDPLYRKAIRVSVGAALIAPMARFAPGADALGMLREASFTPIALSPAGARDLRDLPRPPRAALLLGAEGRGLPSEVMAQVQTARIPMAEGFDSLNVATASGIALHYLLGGRPGGA